jgi:hypothetical protein
MVHRSLVICAVVSALASASGTWAQTVLPEVQVTKTHIADFEFDWGRDGVHCPTCNGGAGNARFTFTDSSNNLWVGNIDHATGAFVPSNGRGVLADVNAAQVTDFGNGPEWLNTATGSRITYVKYLPGQPHTSANAGIAVAAEVNGVWSGRFVDGGMQRYSPLGSLDLGDTAPRLLYQGSTDQKAYWRYVDNPASEKLLPSDRPVCSRRWVPGRHAVVYTAPCFLRSTTKPAQAYWVDVDTGTEQQITFDATSKLHAFAWQAPEFNNDWVLFTVADRVKLEVHRQTVHADGSRTWALVNSISTPPSMPYVTSPESFVHNGKSYIVMQLSASATASDYSVPTQIAITGIEPGVPSFRMLTNDSSVPRLRLDPEYYITSQGPFVYYNRFIASTPTSGVKLEGVWRVDTLLGPPNPQ